MVDGTIASCVGFTKARSLISTNMVWSLFEALVGEHATVPTSTFPIQLPGC
eukprot:TRINITY_DN22563_c0_g1_i1.p2 TRINITY_DN22563_c0_g1~~TRINITY_DN22563_c0_g1_i1.p2  ORF type:complete len:51 (+),score=1.46 TRINITY_DN22563_c0_g1_i1:208-360(+)